MWLIPSRRQWKMWSLPNKLTAIGAYLGIAGILITISPLLIPYSFASKQPHLTAELHLMIGGYRMRIANNGDALAKGVYVDVVSWGNGAPDASIRISKEIRDLPRKSDCYFDIDLFSHGTTTGIDHQRHSSSGYIVVSCSNCDLPRAWAFYIPGEGHYPRTFENLKTTSWPIVEFNYPDDKPGIGEVVNYPDAFDSESGWYPKKQ